MYRRIAHHQLTNDQPVSKLQLLPRPIPFSFAVLSHDPYGMEHLFGQFRWSVLILFPPSFLCSPAPSLAEQYKRLRNWDLSLALCSTTQQHLKHPQCVISTVFFHRPKHNIISDTVKKINSIPAETWTADHLRLNFTSVQYFLCICSSLKRITETNLEQLFQ